MSDLYHQNLATVQSDKQVNPVTLASAATITPTTFLTHVTGTVQIATIIPPTSGCCMIALNFTNAAPGVTLTSGNIKAAYTPIQNRPLLLIYEPSEGKWYAVTVA